MKDDFSHPIKNGKLVTFDDIFIVIEKLLDGDLIWRLTTFLHLSNRIAHRWNNAYANEYRHWYQVPEIIENWNLRISGDRNIDVYKYVSTNFLMDKTKRSMLSIGCGSGDREIAWWETGCFSKIDGIDVSPEQVRRAKTRVESHSSNGLLNFNVRNYEDLIGKSKYDVIYFGQSLHHFENIEIHLQKINQLLNDDGLLIVDEFFGPRRFQWTETQMGFANMLLMTLPEHLRKTQSGRLKSKCRRRGRILMRLSDPSEAIDSEGIFEAINNNYDLCIVKPYGGTILHILLQDIAFNFLSSESKPFINKLVLAENFLIDNNFIDSDFRVLVARKKGTG